MYNKLLLQKGCASAQPPSPPPLTPTVLILRSKCYSAGGTALVACLLPPPRLPRAPLPGAPLGTAGGGVGTMPPALGGRARRDGDDPPEDGGRGGGRAPAGGVGDTAAEPDCSGGGVGAAGEVGPVDNNPLRFGDAPLPSFLPKTSPASICGRMESLCADAKAFVFASQSSANSSSLGCTEDLPLNETYLCLLERNESSILRTSA